jgi:hypothetical protein
MAVLFEKDPRRVGGHPWPRLPRKDCSGESEEER